MSCRCAHLKRLKEAGRSFEEKSTAYMDYNAAAPPDRRILALYQNESLRLWAHPSSPHLAGSACEKALEEAGRLCRRLTRERFPRVEFNSGSSEGIRRVLEGTEGAVITGRCDHSAVLDQARTICGGTGRPLILIDVDRKGRLDPVGLEEALKESRKTGPGALLIYSPVNHETGAVQDCRRIAALAEETGARIFLDAAQAAVRLPEEHWLPYGDGFCLSCQKLGGLKGAGLLFLKEDFPLSETLEGSQYGSQYGSQRGTPDVPGAVATAETLRLFLEEKKGLLRNMELLTTEGMSILEGGRFEIRRLSPEDAAPGVLCLALPELESSGRRSNRSMEDLFYHLNLKGICLSRFSACSGSVSGPSAVLKAMGFPAELNKTSLRISLGAGNKREDFFRLRKALDGFFAS